MKTSRFSEPQILAILRQAEGGVPVLKLCREHGMSTARASGVFGESSDSLGFDFMIQHGRRTCHVSRLFFGPSPTDC